MRGLAGISSTTERFDGYRAALTDRGIELSVGKTGRKLIIRWSCALRIATNAALALSGDAGAVQATEDDYSIQFGINRVSDDIPSAGHDEFARANYTTGAA